MDQTLLLGTVRRIVSRIEVGNQNTLEPLEGVLYYIPLSSRVVHVIYRLHTGKRPDIPIRAAASDANLCFIAMHQRPLNQPLQQQIVSPFVLLCHALSEFGDPSG